jgi:hypothetical protein
MGLGLYMVGTGAASSEDPAALLQSVEEWCRRRLGPQEVTLGNRDNGAPVLCLSLHPAAEDVEVIADGATSVVVSAKTSTVGPGYHAYLCELLDEMSRTLSVRWLPPDEKGEIGDETGYFQHRDIHQLEHEMLVWLGALAKDFVQHPPESGESTMLSMPIGHTYDSDTPVLTPLGPRDQGWFVRVAADPRDGIDFFPWWSVGRGAGFYLGRALCRMWSDVRWRPPLDDAETALLDGVLEDLAAAWRPDPNRDYPWREWAEIAVHVGREEFVPSEVGRRAFRDAQAPLVGYRRRMVRVYVAGGWSIRLPGSFAERWDDDDSWCAWDATRTVWFTAFAVAGSGPPRSAEELLSWAPEPEGEGLEHRGGELISKATVGRIEEDGEWLWRLRVHAAVPGHRVVCSIVYSDPAHRDWAIETWRSVSHAG